VGAHPRLNDAWALTFDRASDIVLERSQSKIVRFGEDDFNALSDLFEDLSRQLLHLIGRRQLTGRGLEGERREARAVAAPSEPTGGGWAASYDEWAHSGSADEEASRYYERLGREAEANQVQYAAAPGFPAETRLCEHGCGKSSRIDLPTCPGCGRDKITSWVCTRCLRVSSQFEPLCRGRFTTGCEGEKLAGRAVDVTSGCPDAQRAARAWQARADGRRPRDGKGKGKGGGGGKGQQASLQPRPRGSPGSYGGGGGPLRLTN
jgi:hypothetical protein